MNWLTHDRAGQPITLERWIALRLKPSYFIVRQERTERWLLTASWEGIDPRTFHSEHRGPKLDFAIYLCLKPLRQHTLIDRYSTEDVVIAAHKRLAAFMRHIKARVVATKQSNGADYQ